MRSEENLQRAEVISGTAVAKEIRESLKEECKKLAEQMQGFRPGLAIVQVGDRKDGSKHLELASKAATDVGMKAMGIRLLRSTTQKEVLDKINLLNEDPSVHGIVVLMPLDADNQIDSQLVANTVLPEKDVDGLNIVNKGRRAAGDFTSGFLPCTPLGCLELIERSGVPIAGSEAVILGYGQLVGSPISELLVSEGATITVCHVETKDIQKHTSQADILVVAIGQPEFVKGNWIKRGAVVIDCGNNYVQVSDGTYRLVGDVAFDEAVQVASHITPVPGGVGPVTLTMELKNTVTAAQRSIKVKSQAKVAV